MLISGSFLYNNPYLFDNDKAGRIAHASPIKELRNVSNNMEPT
jgi:hypothetical protein